MLHRAKELQEYAIHALDGELGKVRTFYFDEEEWDIQSMVVDTGAWFANRHVLIPADVLGHLDQKRQRLTVELTQNEVWNSPEAPKHKASSIDDTIAMQAYSGCRVYWSHDPSVLQLVATRPAAIPIPAAPLVGVALTSDAIKLLDIQNRSVLSRSTQDILGYAIQATDGPIGYIEDVVIDTSTWDIRYMVVDTRHGRPSKKLLISSTWLHQVHWDTMQIVVALQRDRIEESPEFDASVPLDRDYEARLFNYYGRPTYWSR
jgi:sporulation protein YlmC with PRC-barrel domain